MVVDARDPLFYRCLDLEVTLSLSLSLSLSIYIYIYINHLENTFKLQ